LLTVLKCAFALWHDSWEMDLFYISFRALRSYPQPIIHSLQIAMVQCSTLTYAFLKHDNLNVHNKLINLNVHNKHNNLNVHNKLIDLNVHNKHNINVHNKLIDLNVHNKHNNLNVHNKLCIFEGFVQNLRVKVES
jgi:hypothetical protein